MAGWEIILAAAFMAVLLFSQWLMRPFSKSGNSNSEFRLWIAQGFGIGQIPFAPGTFGSILGIFWFLTLLASGRWWVLLMGMVAGLGLSIWLCGFAEKRLHQKDPGSVVLDEVTAVPLCFLVVVAIAASRVGVLPDVVYFVSGNGRAWTLLIFAAFRLFDVVKPWPVRQSQSLPGGWGITVDDVLAAVYVNLLVIIIEACKAILPKP